MSDVFIGLGSNLGDRSAQLRFALERLARSPGLRLAAVSPLARTAPVGGPAQPDFLNGVARLEATLAPHQVLVRLQRLERLCGRVRTVAQGPRTLDLDLLLYDGAVLRGEELTLPHPRMSARRFVLEPLSQIAPALRLPDGRTALECLHSLDS